MMRRLLSLSDYAFSSTKFRCECRMSIVVKKREQREKKRKKKKGKKLPKTKYYTVNNGRRYLSRAFLNVDKFKYMNIKINITLVRISRGNPRFVFGVHI